MIFCYGFLVFLRFFFPLFLGYGQLLFKILFIIPKFCSFFIFLFLNYSILALTYFFKFTFKIQYLFRNFNIGDMNTCSGLIKCVNGLVWQETIGHIPVCQLNAGINSLRGIRDIVM